MSTSFVFIPAVDVFARCAQINAGNVQQYEKDKQHCFNTLLQSKTVGWFWNRRKITESEAYSMMQNAINDWESDWGTVGSAYKYIKWRASKLGSAAAIAKGDMQLTIDDCNWLFKSEFAWEK